MANKPKENELKHDVRITLRLTEEEYEQTKEISSVCMRIGNVLWYGSIYVAG